MGLAVAETLEQQGMKYKIVEKRPTLVAGRGDKFIHGDAADLDVLKRAGVEKAGTVIITTHNDAINIYLTFIAVSFGPRFKLSLGQLMKGV